MLLSAIQSNHKYQQGRVKLTLLILLPILFLLTAVFLILAWQATTKVANDSISYQMQEAQNRAQSRLDSYLTGLDNLLISTVEKPKLATTLESGERLSAKKILQDTLEHNYGEYLDLLLLTRQNQYWTNMNSPLYLLGENLNATIMDIPYFTQWSSIKLEPAPTSLTAIMQRYPILSSESGMVIGSLLGGIILNDNLTLLNLLGQDTKHKSLTLLLDGRPVGPTFNDADISETVFDKIIASNLSEGKIDQHFFTRQPLLINGEKSQLQLLLIADASISQPLTYVYLYHQLLALVLFSLAVVAWLMVSNRKTHP
ncbi:LuxQ periplasmic sensor domain-containing protein [Oceanisphaera sp. W20_SRM_FM3]|uniref:LuxQ periplasmic sensor domain-containing protein n=1 Tax=Oceanisphaera sp. W20_SRM_FM3 TaxID=3240267 RepID=UPI003F9B0704